MKANKTTLILGGIAAGVAAVWLYKFVKHETAEMKKEEEGQSNFTADEGKFMNYVDEGFMGFTASDEFMMLGGSKPIEFANASGHKVPVATDEPNFAYANGAQVGYGRTGRGKKIYPSGRPVKGYVDPISGEATPAFEKRTKYAKLK